MNSSSRKLFAILSLILVVVTAHAQIGYWVYKAHMSVPRTGAAAVAGQDGKIYVFGGGNAGIFLKTAEVYDPSTDSWSPIKSMPFEIEGIAAVALPDGRFLFTGLTTSANNVALMYDPATDTYSNAPAIPGNFLAPPPKLALGNDGNVIAAADLAPQIWSYNITGGTWQRLADNALVPSEASLATDSNGIVYATGGNDGAITKTQVTYNDHTHVWLNNWPMTIARKQHTTTFTVDGRLYAIGGTDGTNPIQLVEAFDPATAKWTFASFLNTGRYNHATAVDGSGRIYAIGGNNGSTNLDSVEVYQPSLLVGNGTPITTTEGHVFSGVVAKFKDLGSSESPINYTAAIQYGGGATVGVVSAGDTPGSFVVTATFTTTSSFTHETQIYITDSDGDSNVLYGEITSFLANINGDGIDFSGSSNVPFFEKIAHFTYDNPLETGENLTATVDWGDGSGSLPATITANNQGGFDVSAGHTYTSSKSYQFMVNIFKQGLGRPLFGTAVISPAPPVVAVNSISGVEGTLFSGKVANFTNPDPNIPIGSFSASIDWGDGFTTSGVILSDGAGGFNVNGSHTYSRTNSYTVRVNVSVLGGGTGTGTNVASIANAPLTATGFSLICKTTKFTDSVASISDGNHLSMPSDFTVNIFWGDGKSSAGTLTGSNGSYRVLGNHTYAKKGKFTATVTVRDRDGASTSTTSLINVGPVK